MTNARSRPRSRASLVLVAVLLAGAVGGWAAPRAGVLAQTEDDRGVTTIVGTLSVEIAAEPTSYILLTDLTGFVRRDHVYTQGSQPILGWIDHASGIFQVDLPIVPSGAFNDVGHGQGGGPGVQIYSVDPYGDVLADPRPGPMEFFGWSWWWSSLVNDLFTHEVIGGQIAVWAPDDAQLFPTDPGADGKLFTADDPVAPISTGWTVVDLDERPFAPIRSARAEVRIGANEFTPIELSHLPAPEAFDALVAVMAANYPMADAKPINWEALRVEHRPAFEAAEQSGDRLDFEVAVNNFVVDTGVYEYFTNYPVGDYYNELFRGSTGLHAGGTDDGRVIVVALEPGQAAEQAGIQVGAELLTWDGKPAMQAVEEMTQGFAASTPHVALQHKLGFFGRLPAGTAVAVTFRNPGASEESAATLTAVEIPDEFPWQAAQCFRARQVCDFEQPVSFERLQPANIAYIRIRDLGFGPPEMRMVGGAWELVINHYNRTDVNGLILDLRGAGPSGPNPLVMEIAGTFFTEEFPFAQITRIDANGQLVDAGTVSVRPSGLQWNRPVAVLVDHWCITACEVLVQALTHNPNVIIVGMTPTAGSGLLQGRPVILPAEDFVLLAEHVLRDPATGEVLFSGTGIAPTLWVPRTPETLVVDVTGDPVKDAAIEALLAQAP